MANSYDLLYLYNKIKGWHYEGKLRKVFPFSVKSQMSKISRTKTPAVVHSPSLEVFNHSAEDRAAGRVQKESCIGCLSERGDKVLWILRRRLRYEDIYVLNWRECSSGVFRVLSAISHLSVKKHLKPGHCVFPERWWWLEVLLLFLFSCTKSSEEFVINSYNCVLILFQPFITF